MILGSSGRGGTGRGQSSVIGVVLIVAITALGTTGVVVLGTTLLDDSGREADLDRAEQAMTQFDSRASQVALGDSATQRLDLGRFDGGVEVREDTGRMTVTHVDYDGEGTDQVLHDEPMGALVYRNGDARVAYEGGGVWRKDDAGAARLVSPPEFHYRGGTMTLPAVRVTAADSASVTGARSVRVTRPDDGFERVFPDSTRPYDGSETRHFENPLEEGHVTVTVQSEYYEGWAEYFRDRTDGEVTTDDEARTATVELVTLGEQGEFGVPEEGSDFEIRGMPDDHNLTDFDFTIQSRDDQNSQFSNLKWSTYVDSGDEHFEVAVRNKGNLKCDKNGDIDDDPVTVSVYYSTYEDGERVAHGWRNDEDFTATCAETDDGGYIAALPLDFTGTDTEMTYADVSGDLNAFEHEDATFADSLTIDEHDADVDADAEYTLGDTESLEFLTKHYFAELGPDFELRVTDQQSGKAAGVSERDSDGFIEYEADDSVITYLHVTDNEVRVDLN
ncbi:DUF7289 family protein [Halomarina ordinaria]|uniref:DUF7308 domain-containing protein n=1 Tax=Halomarina ordinaria TaxID=3033939 RepID=A0ABD5U7F0_9EURY|nr:hypothetical protein [Halomarina sp. PSRA2]